MKFKVPEVAKKTLYASYAVSLIQIGVAVAAFLFLQPELPLFYTLAEEEQQLAPKIWVLIFPLLSVIINLIHSVLISLDTKKEVVLLSLFARVTTVLQVALLLALLRIVYITI